MLRYDMPCHAMLCYAMLLEKPLPELRGAGAANDQPTGPLPQTSKNP